MLLPISAVFTVLNHFVTKVITAPESRLRTLVTEAYAEDIYANKELMTTVNKFGEHIFLYYLTMNKLAK